MIVLVTATRMEMDAVLAGFGDKAVSPEEGNWRLLEYGRRRFCLLVTGIGPVNAALSLGRLLGSQQGLMGVCNLGVAGSFDLGRFPLESFALPSLEIWPEFGLRTDSEVQATGLKLAQAPGGLRGQDGPVYDRLRLDPRADGAAMGLILPEEYPEAVALSVAGVTACAGLARKFRSRYQADLENMEGFALALAAFRHNLPFVEVRSVSNCVGSRSKEDWRLKQALKKLSELGAALFSKADA